MVPGRAGVGEVNHGAAWTAGGWRWPGGGRFALRAGRHCAHRAGTAQGPARPRPVPGGAAGLQGPDRASPRLAAEPRCEGVGGNAGGGT